MLAFISLITVGLSEALTRAREQLKASERRYRTIFVTTITGMAIIEADTTISLANSEFERLSGFAKDEIEKKMSWQNFVAGNYSERMYAGFLPDDFGEGSANRSKQVKTIECGGRRDGHAYSDENRCE